MFSGGNRTITPEYRVKDEHLVLRPYNAALGALTAKICYEANQTASDVCLFETRLAFDCLLRNKARKFGDITDNVGACKHHIASMKAALPGHEALLSHHIDEITNMRRSFV